MRLDQLAEELGDRITIEWKTFLLRVEPTTPDREEFIEYTKSWLRPAEQEPAAEFTVWASDEEQPLSSVPAQVAHKTVTAFAPDQAREYHDRLLRAYFTENQNIGDSDTLLDLAAEIGIDRAGLEQVARDRQEEFTQEVIAEHNMALESGINAVPSVVFDHAFAVPGAQPVETYKQLIERMEEKHSSG